MRQLGLGDLDAVGQRGRSPQVRAEHIGAEERLGVEWQLEGSGFRVQQSTSRQYRLGGAERQDWTWGKSKCKMQK